MNKLLNAYELTFVGGADRPWQIYRLIDGQAVFRFLGKDDKLALQVLDRLNAGKATRRAA